MSVPFPPLSPVAEYPLHPEGIYEGHYWACTQPERPRSHVTAYDWRCRPCVQAAIAGIANQGDVELSWTRTGGVEPELKRLSWMVERSAHFGVFT